MQDYIQRLIDISNQEPFSSAVQQQEHLRRMSLFPHIFTTFIEEDKDKEGAIDFIHRLSLKATEQKAHICYVLAKVASLLEENHESAVIPQIIRKYEMEFLACLQYIVTGAKALEDNLTEVQIERAKEVVLEVTRRQLSQTFKA